MTWQRDNKYELLIYVISDRCVKFTSETRRPWNKTIHILLQCIGPNHHNSLLPVICVALSSQDVKERSSAASHLIHLIYSLLFQLTFSPEHYIYIYYVKGALRHFCP